MLGMTPEELKRMRSEVGLSMADMAKEIGVPKPTYVNWEYGRAYPNQLMAERIAKVHASLTGRSFIQVPIDSDTYVHLAEAARRKGKSVEGTVEEILQTIFGPMVITFLIGVALAFTSNIKDILTL